MTKHASWDQIKVILERFLLLVMGTTAFLVVLSYHPDVVEKEVLSRLSPEQVQVFQDGTSWIQSQHNTATLNLKQINPPNITASAVHNQSQRISLQDEIPVPTKAGGSWLSRFFGNGDAVQREESLITPDASSSSTELPSFASVPMALKPKALFIQVKVNDMASGHFILDTGATYTTISKRMARQLGLDLANSEKIAITTANGELAVPKVKLKTVSVNGIEARNVEATVMDFGEGNSFAGLLGLSFIQHFKLTLDPKNGQMTFEPI
jgi:clan AA aspartic protease (TIGR02281 family)